MHHSGIYLSAATLVLIAAAVVAPKAVAAPGDLDLLFGINGKVMTSSGFKDEANAIAIQPDGKIVIAGTREQSPNIYNGLVARYNSDGSLDTSFGIGGFVTDVAHGAHSTYFRAVKIQPDGKVIVAGDFFENGGCTGYRPWVLRYNADGSRDTSFGVGGAVEFFFYCGFSSVGHLNAIAIQPNGKIVVAGSSETSSGTMDFAAARFNSNGEFDTTFNTDGLATFPIGSGNEEAFSVAVHPTNGKIVLAGYSINSASNKDFALIMLGSNGLYDLPFGPFGKVTVNFAAKHDQSNSVIFQPDGKVLAGGFATYALMDLPDQRFAFARFTTSGALDSTFGTGGKVTTNFGPLSESANSIALQPNGKIVAAGTQANSGGTYSNFALVRYNSSGTPDTTFSGDGKLTTDFLGGADYGRGLAIQTDGKLVVAGRAANGSDYDIALARYEP